MNDLTPNLNAREPAMSRARAETGVTNMGSPQDPRTTRRKRIRRAKKNLAWEANRARENDEAAQPKTPAKKAI